MIFEYTEKIPKQIPKALKETLGLNVKSLSRIKAGEVNYSFRVDTDNKPVIVRVFRYDSWPMKDTLRLVGEKLEELGIKQSKIISFDSSDKYFQNGFMVGEWIEGVPGEEAIKQGLVTEERIVGEVAKILKKVHTVKFERFGRPPFHQDNKDIRDFSSFVLGFDGENRLEELVEERLVSGELIESGENLLKSLLSKIDFVVEPVMVHGDAAPENIIWTKDGPVLVDWEDAKATSWSYDLAWLTYWYDWYANKVLSWFLKGYGASSVNLNEFRLLERIFHLMLALKLLPYYAYDIQNKRRLKSGVKRLQKLVGGYFTHK